VGKRGVRFPAAYIIAVPDREVVANLLRHGLVVEVLEEPAILEVEAFRLKEIKPAEGLYQGHRMNRVKGEYILEKKEFSAGTYLVSTAQPLAGLAAYLLEPESDDGLLVWNFFDRHIAQQWSRALQTYPVYKLISPANLAKKVVR
jgi:hypothetical protein